MIHFFQNESFGPKKSHAGSRMANKNKTFFENISKAHMKMGPCQRDAKKMVMDGLSL